MADKHVEEKYTFTVAYRCRTRVCDTELVGCEPQNGEDSLFMTILSTLAACNVVLRKLCWRYYVTPTVICNLRTTLGEHVGPLFEELDIAFSIVGQQDLGDFLSRCSNLTSLSIVGNLATAANIAAIPRCCPNLISLGLKCDNLSDDAVCAMLDEFRGRHLKALALSNYSPPVIVHKIAEVLSRLDNLTIVANDVDKKHLLVLLLSRSLQVASLKLGWHIIRWFRDELRAARFMPMPKLVDGHT